MGTVFEAEESESGRRVAVKLLSQEIVASAEGIERFRQEGRLASTIAHPRCVFVLAADEQGGWPFIVMELMPGTTLQDLVHEEGPLPVEQAAAKILDAIEGLREAHRLGVIHRDVKPSNCFLEADGRVKVGDFGLSKSLAADLNLTRTGSFLGTPLYASPEQIKGESVDGRTDIYSVAATLYYCLTGRAPFAGGPDAAATLARIVSESAPSMLTFRPDIPVALDRIVLKGLERQRERRWRDLDDFAIALRRFAPGRPPIADLGLRFAAFVFDIYLSKFTLITAWNVARFFLHPDRYLDTWRVEYGLGAWLDVLLFAICFGLVEPWFGASPGKLLLGLRVRSVGGSEAHPRRILIRNLNLFAFLSLPLGLAVLGLFLANKLDELGWLVWPLRVACMLVVAAPMRANNGFAGLHELLTGTRTMGQPRAESRRAAGLRRALGRERAIEPRPIGVLKSVGPYKVRGAVRWEEGRKVLSAEDSTLGREAWIVMRPRSSPPPPPNRREMGRPSRPRWLAGGEQAEGRWDAYVAPSGCPLSDLAGPHGLPWRDARPILEDLVEELDQACRDQTLPPGLHIDQVWIQPDGRALLVDPLAVIPLDLKEFIPPTEPHVLALLHETAALALEGGRWRKSEKRTVIRAPLPKHASAILDRLGGETEPYPGLAPLRQELASTHDRPTEVSRRMRGTHLVALSGVWIVTLVACMAIAYLASVAGLIQLNRDKSENFSIVIDSLTSLLIMYAVVVGGVAAWAAATRGGIALALLGMALVNRHGRPASRVRCGWRALIAWIPPAGLTLAAILAEAEISRYLLALAAILTALHIPMALLNPASAPHDRLAGTCVVPK